MKNVLILSALILLGACTAQVPVPDDAQVAQPAAAASPTPQPSPEKIDTALEAELARAAEPARGKVGVGAFLVETGDAAYLGRGVRHPMQSVYKLPIAMRVLKMIDEGKITLDQQVSITPSDFVRPGFHSPIRNQNPQGIVMPLGEILRYSLSESDGTASDVLLDLAGGPAEVQSFLASLGVEGMAVANSEKEISRDWETQYRNWSTPEASIKLLSIIQQRSALSPQMSDLLFKLMTETETGERRLKTGLPEGASLAHKTGTGGTRNGITGATNDIGIITMPDGRRILIAVYIMDSSADAPTREKVIADIARTVTEKWQP